MSTREINWPKHPIILEINTWPWLNGLSERYNKPITLSNVPREILDNEFTYFDVVWLMGVWERSPRGRDIAIEHPGLQEEYRNALEYFNTNDVVGSPYSIHYYHVDTQLGGKDSLATFRRQLAKRDLLLLLDYVPNHVSIDHLWTLEKSDVFIKGTTDDFISYPDEFFSVGDMVYANGKDPFFPPWSDTAQINAFSSEARQKAINTLLSIAEQSDGVRCDMAMLMTNSIFSRTWGTRAGQPPEEEYWNEVIRAIRENYPKFKFLAEVYWDMEWELQQQGFDFCYDKRLYDRLIHENAQSVRTHLQAEWDYQSKLLRFIENHDEQRAIITFGEEKSMAAAIIALTLPGARLIHEGQIFGYKIKLPVQLGRRVSEEKNHKLTIFYQNLLKGIPGKDFGEGKWMPCIIESIDDNNFSNENLIAYQWKLDEKYLLIVVNYSPIHSQGHVRVEEIEYGVANWNFIDLLVQRIHIYKGENLSKYGLFVDLGPWHGHVFDVSKRMHY